MTDTSIWIKRIQDCEASGKSVNAWCKENNVSRQLYYYYKKRNGMMKNKCGVITDDDRVRMICEQLVSRQTLHAWCLEHDVPERTMIGWRNKLYNDERYIPIIREYEIRANLLHVIDICNLIYEFNISKLSLRDFCDKYNVPFCRIIRAKRAYRLYLTDEENFSDEEKLWYECIKDQMRSGKNIKMYCKEHYIGYSSFNEWNAAFKFAGKIPMFGGDVK